MDERLRKLEREANESPEARKLYYRELCCSLSESEQEALNKPGTIPEPFQDWDWEEVFKYAAQPRVAGSGPHDPDALGFSREDVKQVISYDNGENDLEDWVALMQLWDGRFAYIEAGCDYTGWG